MTSIDYNFAPQEDGLYKPRDVFDNFFENQNSLFDLPIEDNTLNVELFDYNKVKDDPYSFLQELSLDRTVKQVSSDISILREINFQQLKELVKGHKVFRALPEEPNWVQKFLARISDTGWGGPIELESGKTRANLETPRAVQDMNPYLSAEVEQQVFKKVIKNLRGSKKRIFLGNKLSVDEFVVPIRGLKKEHEGLRILVQSDTHYEDGKFLPIQQVSQVAHAFKTKKLRLVDIHINLGDRTTAMPKDYCELSVQADSNLLELCGARYAFYVHGNHCHYPNELAIENIESKIKQLKIASLDLTGKVAEVNVNGAPLDFVGIGEYFEGHNVSPNRASHFSDKTTIAIAHGPDDFRESLGHADLLLAGHTHQGEFRAGLRTFGMKAMKLRGYLLGINGISFDFNLLRSYGEERNFRKSILAVARGFASHIVPKPLTAAKGPEIYTLVPDNN